MQYTFILTTSIVYGAMTRWLELFATCFHVKGIYTLSSQFPFRGTLLLSTSYSDCSSVMTAINGNVVLGDYYFNNT